VAAVIRNAGLAAVRNACQLIIADWMKSKIERMQVSSVVMNIAKRFWAGDSLRPAAALSVFVVPAFAENFV